MFWQTILAITASWLSVTGCAALGAPQAASAAQMPFVTLEKGSNSAIRDRKLVVVKTEGDWENLWREHGSTVSPSRKLPSIDFKQEMVVAVFAGEKRTGGYGIEVARIEEDAGKHQVRVFFRETKPPPGATVIQALTLPYHIVKLKRLDLPVEFVSLEKGPGP